MKEAQRKRIIRMEDYLNELSEVLNELNEALDKYVESLPKLKALKEYYTSPIWMQDFEDSNKDSFPSPIDLPHGILSEDAIFNMLTNQRDTVLKMQKISTNALDLMQ